MGSVTATILHDPGVDQPLDALADGRLAQPDCLADGRV
jgi:hypothetical protein